MGQIHHLKLIGCGTLASIGLLAISESASAAGFAIRNQSTSGSGTALASDTVNISDATGLFTNPAIMSELSGQNISLNLNYTNANISVSDASLSTSVENVGRVPHPREGATSVGSVSDPVVIPAVFGVHEVTPDIHLGWYLAVPWATNTQYNQDWAGRYHGIKTELRTTELTIAGSYRINEMFNVGLGINIQQAEGEFTSAVDLGFINQTPEQFGQADAISRFKGDSIGYGFQIGLLAKPIEELRVGFSYRSEIKHKASGDMTFTPTNAAATDLLAELRGTAPAFAALLGDSTDAELELTLPSVTSLGVAYTMDVWTFYGNISYTTWSSFDEFTPQYNGVRSQTVLDWNDSLFVAVGSEYQLDDAITIRFGLAQDQGVTEDNRRTPRTPDNDRFIVALGGGYQLNENVSFNAAYQKLFVSNAGIDLSDLDYADARTRGNLRASLEIDPHIFMLSADMSF